VFVHADRNRFNQILLNLLSNAIKYNRLGGRVEISFQTTTTPASGPRSPTPASESPATASFPHFRA
jgi:light-regulated signal transduction histidine kinase (bacteriophytochrome)